MDASEILDELRRAVPEAILEDRTGLDMPAIAVDREHLIEVCRTLRDAAGLQFALLVDITSVDYLPAHPRYEVVYHVAALGAAYAAGEPAPPRRLRVKVAVPADDPQVPSLTSIYPAADWPEREVFDLMGISFAGHPDLRRILMPEDWEGYPLRKDYPVQIRKETSSWSPVQLTVEEFAANVRAERQLAARQAGTEPRDAD
jgi:NADH-quinone oxidoreductase subunit C